MPIRNRLPDLSPSQRVILEALRNHDKSSRAELAGITGLTPGALSRQIRELLELSLVSEGDRRSGLRGQPARPISIRADAAYSIGVAFSLHEIEVVGIDFKGRKVAGITAPHAFETAGELVDQCSTLVRDLEKSLPDRERAILGVGVALPAYFRPGTSIVMETFGALVKLAGVELDVFLSAFGQPTWIENISSAAVLAEFYDRRVRTARNLVLINIGYGFSAGFVIDGKLYRGRDGNAGEVGRLYPRGTPRPSALDLIDTMAANGIAVRGRADIEALLASGNPLLDTWIARAGAQLKNVVRILDYAFAPDQILLGGQISTELIQKLGQAVEQASHEEPWRARFSVSRLGVLASAIGAAFLPIYQTSSPRLGPRSTSR